MEWAEKYLAVWQARITLGLAFFGAIIVGLWPDHPRDIDPAKLLACITTGTAWLIAELASAVRPVSAHDRELFSRIESVLDDGALTFLSDHDFAINFNSALTRPVNEIAEWHGPNYEFNDAAIQKRWDALWNEISELSNLYGKYLVTTDNVNILTAWHLGFSRHEQPPQAHAEVKELNEGAQNLYTSYHKFVRYVRRRMRL